MTAELLSTAEAFRAMLQASYPDREDLLQVSSSDQLVYAKSFDLKDPAPAHEVLAAIRAAQTSGKLRLCGVFEADRPEDIHIDNVKRGTIDFFEGTLTVEDNDRFGFMHRKTYRHVHFYAEDLPLPKDDDKVLPVPQQHYPGDAALIEEGLKMAATGMKYRPIARALAPRAEGPMTELTSREDRLRKAIAAEHKRKLGGK